MYKNSMWSKAAVRIVHLLDGRKGVLPLVIDWLVLYGGFEGWGVVEGNEMNSVITVFFVWGKEADKIVRDRTSIFLLSCVLCFLLRRRMSLCRRLGAVV